METAALRIGCKVNLTLRITGVRPNGWHELDTVFLPLDEPSDTLRLALRPGGGLALHCAEPGIDPENNTLTKAYRLFAEASGFRPGVEAVLEKGIPHGAGLGGGSADAAALLGWLNARAPEPLPLPELVGLAARIGADVPFALLGGTCRVRGVGDLMKALPPCPDCRFVVAMPSVGVSTPEAFARYDTMGSPVHPDCEAQEQAIRDCNLAGVCAAGGNALEHCSGAVETPAICKTLREHGAVMAQMTGSGAAVFGIFDDENAARSAVAALKNGYKQVYLCKPTHGGPRVTVRRLFGAKK